MAILVFGAVRFPPENIAALRPHIKALVEATNKNDGCDLYEVAEDLFDPGLLRFSEIWPDQASFSRHISAPHIVPWREAGAKFGLIERSFKLFDGTNERPL